MDRSESATRLSYELASNVPWAPSLQKLEDLDTAVTGIATTEGVVKEEDAEAAIMDGGGIDRAQPKSG